MKIISYFYLILLLSFALIDLSKDLRLLIDQFTFIALYYTLTGNTLSLFIIFSYPYLYKKLSK